MLHDPGASPAAIISALTYKPGWSFKIAGPGGRFLCIHADTPDSMRPATHRSTQHQFEIPDGIAGRTFVRWVRDCLLLAERHEACEFLAIDGFRPFFPHHQDEGSPYELVERWEA